MAQGKLEGIMAEIPEIEAAAKQYVEVRDRRMALTKDEVEAHGVLLEAMKKAGVDFYPTTEGLNCTRTSKEKVKVSHAKDSDADAGE